MMFAARQILKYASNSIVNRPAASLLSYFSCYPQTSIISSSLLNFSRNSISPLINNGLTFRSGLLQIDKKTQLNQNKSVTQYSFTRGKRKTVRNVLKRFYRLDWGIWIRTKCGRHKKLYKKSSAQKRRLKEHVFCNAQQSNLLDKMVTKFWKQPKYFVDDPYEPYHKREEFVDTRKTPMIRDR